MSIIQVPAHYYAQCGIDITLPHPGTAMNGWGKADIPIEPERTAVIIMHAWQPLPPDQWPEQYEIVEYLSRVEPIVKNRIEPFLEAVRASGVRLIHVAAGFEPELQEFAGYNRIREKYPPTSHAQITCSEAHKELELLRRIMNLGGSRERYERIEESYYHYTFRIKPQDHEDVVCASNQLFSLCRDEGIDHLIYTGFAVNACLKSSPCGYTDMTRHGIMCSIVGDLTTAVESKETCEKQICLENGLWQYAVWGGFVFLAEDLKNTLLKKKTKD